jgi:predicted heme/steroid binding protein
MWLTKINRFFAWILLLCIFLYFLSGYGMTKGIISPSFSTKLHLHILPLITLIAFTLHSSLSIRLALMRWRIWNKFSLAILTLIYLVFFLGVIYVNFAYQPNNNYSVKVTNNTQTIEKFFTLQELAQYNGQNGQSAYVAVDDLVYDLSSIFRNGQHQGHLAGQDLTDYFYSQHAKSQLINYPVVGRLK